MLASVMRCCCSVVVPWRVRACVLAWIDRSGFYFEESQKGEINLWNLIGLVKNCYDCHIGVSIHCSISAAAPWVTDTDAFARALSLLVSHIFSRSSCSIIPYFAALRVCVHVSVSTRRVCCIQAGDA